MNFRRILLFGLLLFAIGPALGMTQEQADTFARQRVEGLNLPQELGFSANFKSKPHVEAYLRSLHSLTILFELQRRLAPAFTELAEFNRELATHYQSKGMLDIAYIDDEYELFEQDGQRYIKYLSGSHRGKTYKVPTEFHVISTLEGKSFYLQCKQLKRKIEKGHDSEKMVTSVYFPFIKRHLDSEHDEVRLIAAIVYSENLKENIRGVFRQLANFNQALPLCDQNAMRFLNKYDKVYLQINMHIQPMIQNIVAEGHNFDHASNQSLQGTFDYFDTELKKYAVYYQVMTDKLYTKLQEAFDNILFKGKLPLYTLYGPATIDRIKAEAGTDQQAAEVQARRTPSPTVAVTPPVRPHSASPHTTPTRGKGKRRNRRKAASPSPLRAPTLEVAAAAPFDQASADSDDSTQSTSSFLETEIQYADRVLQWFDDEFRNGKSSWSIFYHTFSRLADKFIVEYGTQIRRPNKTYREQYDNAYYMGGEIRKYGMNGQVVFRKTVLFNITIGSDGLCYHRGFEAKTFQDLFKAFEQSEYRVEYPNFKEQFKEETMDIEWLHHDEGTATSVADSYTESEYYYKITDHDHGMELVLFKPAQA